MLKRQQLLHVLHYKTNKNQESRLFGLWRRRRGICCIPILFQITRSSTSAWFLLGQSCLSARCLPYLDFNWLGVFAVLITGNFAIVIKTQQIQINRKENQTHAKFHLYLALRWQLFFSKLLHTDYLSGSVSTMHNTWRSTSDAYHYAGTANICLVSQVLLLQYTFKTIFKEY